MGKKSKIAGKAFKGAAKLASFVPGPIGMAAKAASSVVGSIGGKGGVKKRSRFSISKYAKKLMKAKLDAKIQKYKFSALKGL